MNKFSKTVIILACLFLLVVGMQVWAPWHRQPTVFYEPLILPIEAIDGDVIVTLDGSYIVIDGDRTINDIEHHNGAVTIKSTRHITLWEWLIEK